MYLLVIIFFMIFLVSFFGFIFLGILKLVFGWLIRLNVRIGMFFLFRVWMVFFIFWGLLYEVLFVRRMIIVFVEGWIFKFLIICMVFFKVCLVFGCFVGLGDCLIKYFKFLCLGKFVLKLNMMLGMVLYIMKLYCIE